MSDDKQKFFESVLGHEPQSNDDWIRLAEATGGRPNIGRTHCMVTYRIEFDRETDGRWIAEIAELPGVLAYGATQDAAVAAVEALARKVLEHHARTFEKLAKKSD